VREDASRLYNMLGILYYDNGNYRLAKKYFKQALEILKSKKPYDTVFAASLQTNTATSFYRLGQYREALAIYRELLSHNPRIDFVNMNMGHAFAGENDYASALVYYRKVNAKKMPWVWNEIAYTQEQLHHSDSCAWYLRKPQELARQSPAALEPIDLGINALYEAQLLSDRKDYSTALVRLQQAI